MGVNFGSPSDLNESCQLQKLPRTSDEATRLLQLSFYEIVRILVDPLLDYFCNQQAGSFAGLM